MGGAGMGTGGLPVGWKHATNRCSEECSQLIPSALANKSINVVGGSGAQVGVAIGEEGVSSSCSRLYVYLEPAGRGGSFFLVFTWPAVLLDWLEWLAG